MSNAPTLVKDPYVKTKFRDETELNDFIKCCDPENGYLYFLATPDELKLQKIRYTKLGYDVAVYNK